MDEFQEFVHMFDRASYKTVAILQVSRSMNPTPRMMKRLFYPVAVVLAAASLAGCGDTSQTAKKLESQVVARIGPDVVTTQELENELRHNNVAVEKRRDPEVLKKVIGELVARKYAARRALNAKLDREPTVLLDLLRSKDEVLAKAIATRDVDARLAALSGADVEKYIANNPQKFANRQILKIEQLVVPVSASLQPIIDASRTMKSLEEVGQLLAEMSIPMSRAAGAVSTSDMPNELEAAMRNQGLDAVFFLGGAGANGAFLKVTGREPSPLGGPQAEAVARQLIRLDLLKGQSSMAAFSASMEATYSGEYARIMGK